MEHDGRRDGDGLDEMERLVASFAPLRPDPAAAERILAPARREERKVSPATRPLWHPARWGLAWESLCNGLAEIVVAGRWGLATTVILFALNCAVDAMPSRLLETRGFGSVHGRRHGTQRDGVSPRTLLGDRWEELLGPGGAKGKEKDRNG